MPWGLMAQACGTSPRGPRLVNLRRIQKGKVMFPSEPQSQTPRSGDPGAPVYYPLRRGGEEVFEYLRALKRDRGATCPLHCRPQQRPEVRSRLAGLRLRSTPAEATPDSTSAVLGHLQV